MDSNVILMMLKDKIPSQALIIVQEKLQNADEEKVNNLSLVPLKNPIIGLILGLFLGGFGADRFYKGDMGLGIAKIALLFVGGATTFLIIGGFLLLILVIWCVADYFFVWKGIQQDNLNRVLQVLN